MDPHRPILNPAVAQNDDGENDRIQDNTIIPALEPFVSQTSADTQAQPQEPVDIHMDYSIFDDMPGLQEVSDSDSELESDRDAHEVEMQAVDSDDDDDDERAPGLIDIDNHLVVPPSSSSNAQTSIYDAPRRPNSNRRARVEDDEDEERDRRHPSQRVSSANNNAASATSSLPQSSAHLPQNQPHTQPANTPPIPPAQAQRPHVGPHVHDHVHHHIIHATLNVPRRAGDNSHPFRFFQHMMPNNNNGNPAGQTNANPNPVDDNNNTAPAAPPPPQQQQDGNNNPLTQLFDGIAVSFDLGPGFRIPLAADQPRVPPQPQPPAQAGDQPQGAPDANGQAPPAPNQLPPPRSIADLFARIGQTFTAGLDVDGPRVNINFGAALGLGLGMAQEKEDPERARKLVDGLEVVPVGLIRRLERVGGAGGGTGEEPSNGGDAGCAICWDKLLDGDGEGFGKEEKASSDKDESKEETSSSSESETKHPKIVSLPCAHVFHADCLIPWFSRPRHTTCPTCRFNIDPDNLTYVSARMRQREQAQAARRANGGVPAQDGQPPAPQEPASNNANAPAADGPDAPLPPFIAGGDFEGATMQENQFHALLNQWNAPMGQALAELPEDDPLPPLVPAPGSETPPPDSAPATAPSAETTPGVVPFILPPLVRLSSPDRDTAPATAPGVETTPDGRRIIRRGGLAGMIDVIQVPIPIIIPVQVPANPDGAGAQDGLAANGNGPNPTATPGDAPAQPQPQPQPQPVGQNQQGPGGDFAQLLSRMIMRPDLQQPVPFNSLFPAPFFHIGNHQFQPGQGAPQPANAANAPAGAAPAPGAQPQAQAVPLRIYNDPAMFMGGLPPGFPFQQPANNPAPAPGAANEGGNPNLTNQPNPGAPMNQLPANVRADVMRITLDMVFNGPMPAPPAGAAPPPPPSAAAAAQSPVAAPPAAPAQEDGAAADDDFMMVIEESGTGDVDLDRMRNLDEVLELLTADEREEQAEREANNNSEAAGSANPAQPQPAQAAAPPAPQQQEQRPQQQQFNGLPPFLAGFNTGHGVHVATGSGRSINEALSQLLTDLQNQAPQTPAGQPQPQPDAQQQSQQAQAGQEPTQGDASQAQQQQQQQQGGPPHVNMPRMFPIPTFAELFGTRADLQDHYERASPRPKRVWTLPPAPGPSLRQRIERREREAGLRCYDVSCGVGPSDEDPLGETAAGMMKQLAIRSKQDRSELCGHMFHSACLVSAERVALRGADAVVEGGEVEVSCPVCRGVGSVSKEEWDEGVVALT